MLFCLFSVAVIAIIANDPDQYGILGDDEPTYTYIRNDYEDNSNENTYQEEDYNGGDYRDEYYHDAGQMGHAPEYGDGSFNYYGHGYTPGYPQPYNHPYSYPYSANNESEEDYYGSNIEQDYNGGYINAAPSYGIMPLGSPSGPSYIAGLDLTIVGVPTNGIITTAAELTAAINASIDASRPHTTYTRIINIGANFDLGSTREINGARNIWIRTYPETVTAGTIHVLTNGSGRHFNITANARLTISDITISRITNEQLNPPTGNGGGISVGANGTFVMEDGAVVRHNRVGASGGGVLVSGTNARFHMNGGVIRNNWAGDDGGGVAVIGSTSRFYMNGGIIGGHHSLATANAVYIPGTGYTIRLPSDMTGTQTVLTAGTNSATVLGNWISTAGDFLVHRNHADRAGGGVVVNSGGTLIMNYTPCSCGCGCTYASPCNCDYDCTPSQNSSPGMIVGNTGRGQVSSPVPWSNAWTAGGVAVLGQHSSVYMHGGYIRGNWAGHNAGGVMVRNNSLSGFDANGPKFHMFGGSIEYNRSSRSDAGGTGGGGGVALSHGAHFYMYDGSYIRHNFAITTGGGVRIRDGAVMTMYGGSVIHNNGGGGATDNDFSGGGGIFMESLTRGTADTIDLIMYGGRISYNTSRDTRSRAAGSTAMPMAGGGGIFLRGGDLHFRGPNNKYIDGNTSGTHGGGIIWVDSGFMHVDGRATRTGPARPQYANTGMVSISGNHAGYVYNVGAITVPAPGPGIRAGRHGGGIYIQGDYFAAPFFTINNNSATGNGGGVFTRNTVTITGGSVSNNFAGGLIARPATHPAGARPGFEATPIVGLGGGIQIDGAGGLNATDVNINGNSAGIHGGGVNIGGNGAVIFGGTSINSNTVRSTTGDGGGINITGTGAITATNSTVNGNSTGQHGGGINAGGTGAVNITNTSISNNTIRNIGDGGGIRNMSAAMTANTSHIDGNTGARNGGGVFMGGVGTTAANAPQFNMHGGSINSNTATGHVIAPGNTQGGGGVFIRGVTGLNAAGSGFAATFTMNSGEISHNTAIRGGGVFISGAHRTGGGGTSNGGAFVLNNGVISDNRAVCVTYFHSALTPGGGDGAGVYMDGAIREGTGGGGIAHGSNFTMSGGYIEDNRAIRHGGGVFLDRGQAAANTSLGANLARGSLFNMDTGYIRDNTAGYGTGVGDGGGVYLDGLTLYDNNTIHDDTVARFNMIDGSIENNTARDGGGVFVGGGRRQGTNDTDTNANIGHGGRFTIAGTSSVSGNTATRHGGGMFLGGGYRRGTGSGGTASGGRLYMSGNTTIHDNNAINGGGIFAGGVIDETEGTSTRTAQSANISMSGEATIVGNIASENGGGVHLAGNVLPATTGLSPASPRFEFNFGGPGTVANNRAQRGGGFYVGGGRRNNPDDADDPPGNGIIHGAQLILSNTATIGPGNHAYEYGGGVYVSGGVRAGGAGGGATGGILRFGGNASVVGNTTDGRGGGVVLKAGRDIGTGTEHQHSHPGALLSMRGGSITGNTAEYDGGGLWIPNVTATYNIVPFVSDTILTMDLVSQPNSQRNNRRLTGVNISDNTATAGYGGGVWLGRGLNLYLIGSHVVSNTAGRYGGSVFLHAGILGGHGSNTLTMLGGYLSGSAMRGGGVYIQGGTGDVPGATFNMDNTVAIPAVGGAPAIPAGSPTIGNPAGSNLARGTASINGGGVYIQGGDTANNAGTFNMHSGAIGAVYPDGTNRGNIALQSGGGLFIGAARSFGAQAAVFNTPGTTARSFIGNDAGQRGGGIFISNDFNLNLHANTTINNNRARYGGGVWVSPGASMTMQTGGTSAINNNRAYYGGGVFVADEANLTLQSGISVRGNAAYHDGGGVFVAGGTTTEVGGIPITTDGAAFNMTAGIIGGTTLGEANTAERGGGVFVAGGSSATTGNHGQFTLTNGDIRGNRAIYGGGVYISDGHSDAVAISHDGMYIGQAPYYLDGSTDQAPYYLSGSIGRAPYHHEGMSGDSYNSGGISPLNVFEGSGGRFNMNSGHIRYNTVGNNNDAENIIVGNGGGVWIANYGYFYVTNVTFTGNRAIGTLDANDLPEGGMGGAIFTVRNEYRDPMLRVTPNWLGAATTFAYSNIIMSGVSNFSANTAVTLELPPQNATEAIANSLFGTTSDDTIPAPHPLNNADINFMHRPEGTFYFFSTDQRLYQMPNPYIYRLTGNQFILFRTINTHVTDAMFNADPDGRLVRFNANGESLSNLWVEVPFASGSYVATSSNSPIAIDFDGRFTYQLVQVMSIRGFQIPMGQWQITYNPDAPATQNPFTVTVIGHPSPMGFASTDTRFPAGTIHPLTPTEHNIWYFGNWINYELPLTGGIGTQLFIISGSVFFFIAMIGALVLVCKKKMQR